MAEAKKCLALQVQGRPDSAEAARLIRSALQGQPGWGVLEIEIFPGRDGTLLLARPASGVYIREDAVRFLLAGRK